MYYNRKKEIIKNSIIISFILLIAVTSTHYIYYKFKDDKSVDYNSESLEVIFHEEDGNKILINKVIPVTDSVGLTSHAYTFTIKNNLTQPVKFKIKLIEDLEKIVEDECEKKQLSKEFIKVSIKENKENNKIYNLEELKDEILMNTKIKALEKNDYYIRVWVDKESTISPNTELHYHGLIQVVEEDTNSIAMK